MKQNTNKILFNLLFMKYVFFMQLYSSVQFIVFSTQICEIYKNKKPSLGIYIAIQCKTSTFTVKIIPGELKIIYICIKIRALITTFECITSCFELETSIIDWTCSTFNNI